MTREAKYPVMRSLDELLEKAPLGEGLKGKLFVQGKSVLPSARLVLVATRHLQTKQKMEKYVSVIGVSGLLGTNDRNFDLHLTTMRDIFIEALIGEPEIIASYKEEFNALMEELKIAHQEMFLARQKERKTPEWRNKNNTAVKQRNRKHAIQWQARRTASANPIEPTR